MKCKKCGCFLTSKVTCCPICHTYVNATDENTNNNNSNINQQQAPAPAQTQQPVTTTQAPAQTQQPVTTTQSPAPVQTQQPTTKQEEKHKKKKNIFKIIIPLIVVIVAGIFLYPKIKAMLYKPTVAPPEKLFETTSFWLVNNEKKAAIFNEDGKQLTDYIYTKGSKNFANNTALVKNDKEQFAIITSLGKEIVKFGKYDEIIELGANYIAKTSDDKYVLYNRAGKLIKKLKDKPIIFGIGYGLDISDEIYLYSGIYDDNKYSIINYAGEEIFTIPFVENEYTITASGEKKSPKAALYENKYLSVFYNQHNYIINILTKEKIFEFESPLYFNVAAVNEDKNEMFLKSISQQSGWNIDENESIEYKLIRNKEVVYTKTHEEEIDEVYYNNGIIEITDIFGNYILTETGEKLEVGGKGNIVGYIDYNNYIKLGENNTKELYVNNELKNVFNCGRVITNPARRNNYAEYGLYVLKDCKGEKIATTDNMIIKPDGSILNTKIYQYISEFDENGNLIVSEDGETSYLINTKGEKISKNYYFNKYRAEYENGIKNVFNSNKKLYIGTNSDETKTLFDTDGTEYATANEIDEIANVFSDNIYTVLEYDDYNVVYNITKQKEILKTKEKVYTKDQYIEVDYQDKIECYLYKNGKIFYTLELQ